MPVIVATTHACLCINHRVGRVAASKGVLMHVSYGAFLVGALGLVYGLVGRQLSKRQATIGAFVLLVVALALVVVPYFLGVPW